MIVTAQELIDGGLELADMVGSNFITPAGQIRWVNECYSKLYSVILKANEDDFVDPIPTEFTVAPGDSSQPLPSDFYKLVGIDRKYGGEWVILRKFMFNKRNRLQSSTLYTSRLLIPSVRYRLVGTSILFDSQDDAGGDYRIWYMPVSPSIALVTDTFNIETNEQKEFVEVCFAIKALEKEESNTDKLMIQKGVLTDDIIASKISRDEGEPERISDISERTNHDGDESSGWF